MEPNKKLAREHGTKSGQIAIKGAITIPDLTSSREKSPEDGEPQTPDRIGPQTKATSEPPSEA